MQKEKPVKDANQNIQVFVRSRPLNSQEKARNQKLVLDVNVDKREIVMKDKPVTEKVPAKTFTFDKVFDHTSKQVDIYRCVVFPLIEEVLQGYNCTVFAYGQTGTGKTFTMEGERTAGTLVSWDEDPLAGIIPRALHHLFDELTAMQVEFSVKVSFIELYNEELYDLLSAGGDLTKIKIFDDVTRKGCIIITGCEDVIVHNKDEVYKILERGTMKRATASTLMNEHSSRSHSVFTITVVVKENTIDGEEFIKIGKLNLVDLAGSENIGRSGAVEKRAREAANINQSLLTLGRCITALVERTPHIPFRESKLTRLLQDSLGGRTKTSIIATISPAACNVEETLSTLDYAQRAKTITNRPEVNKKMTKRALLKEYTEEIEKLKRELFATREKNGIYMDEDNFNSMQEKLKKQAEELLDKVAEIDALKIEFMRLNSMFEETKEELSTKNATLDSTVIALNETELKLEKTTTVLGKTANALNETNYLVSTHVKTEKDLGQQAKQLLGVANDATNHVEGLHSKLERKTTVESANEKAKSTFHSSFEIRLDDLSKNISDFGQSQSSFCDKMLSSLGDSRTKRMHEIKFVSEKLGHLNITAKHGLDALSNTLIGATRIRQASIDSTLAEGKARIDDEAKVHRAFDEEQLQPKTAELHRKLDECLRELSKSDEEIRAQIEANRLLVQVQNKLQMECLQKLAVLNRDSQMNHNKLVESYGITNNTRNLMAASHQKAVNTQVASIQSALAELMNMECSHLSDLEAIDSKAKADLENSRQHMNTYVANCEKVMAENQSAIERFGLAEDQFLTDLSTAVKKSASSATVSIVALGEQTDQLGSTCKVFNEQQKQAWSTFVTAQEIRLSSEAKTSSADLNSQQKSIRKINAGLTSESDSLQSTIDEQLKSFNCSVDETVQMIASKGAAIHDWKNNTAEDIAEGKSQLLSFINDDLKKDIPTGATPVRTQFVYPVDLAATSPHERILTRFRNDPAVRGANQFVMDDDEEAVILERAQSTLSLDDKNDDASVNSDTASIASSQGESKENRDGQSVFIDPNSKIPQAKREDAKVTVRKNMNGNLTGKREKSASQQNIGPKKKPLSSHNSSS